VKLVFSEAVLRATPTAPAIVLTFPPEMIEASLVMAVNVVSLELPVLAVVPLVVVEVELLLELLELLELLVVTALVTVTGKELQLLEAAQTIKTEVPL
jgi:hypothetical protein